MKLTLLYLLTFVMIMAIQTDHLFNSPRKENNNAW